MATGASSRTARKAGGGAAKAQALDSAKREEIKQAAKALFARQGFVATTIRQIAAAVSVEGGSLYYHIKGKDEVLATLLEEGNRRLLDAAHQCLKDDTGDPIEMLRGLIRLHVQILADDPDQFMVVTRELQHLKGQANADIMRQRDEYEGVLQSLIRAGIDAGKLKPCNVKVTSFGMLGCLNSVAFWFKPDGPLSIDEVADEFADMLLEGLTAEGV